MEQSKGALLSAAWEMLWDASGRFYLPQAISHGIDAPGVKVAPLGSLEFPDTGKIVLFNKQPWGGVSIDLTANTLSNLDRVSGGDPGIDEASGGFTLDIGFDDVHYWGKYIVTTDPVVGSAVETAGFALDATDAGTTDNITLAKNYQRELMKTPNGQLMVGTYHTFNSEYQACFNESGYFSNQWQTYPTNGKTTAYYAQQTSNAAQPANRGTVSVNGDGGNSPYNQHSLMMKVNLVGTCQALAKKYEKTDPKKQKRFENAGLAASTFYSATKPHQKTGQTVDDVFNIVKTEKPPTQDDVDAETGELKSAGKPEDWELEIHRNAQVHVENIHKEILSGERFDTATDQYRGTFHGNFPMPSAKLSGTFFDDGPPRVKLGSITVDPPMVDIELSPLEKSLGAEVNSAIDRAKFLRNLLGIRVSAALDDRQLLDFIERVLNQALTHVVENSRDA